MSRRRRRAGSEGGRGRGRERTKQEEERGKAKEEDEEGRSSEGTKGEGGGGGDCRKRKTSGRWWLRGRRRQTSQPRSGGPGVDVEIDKISFRALSVLVAGGLKVEWRRLQGLHPRQISGATLAAGSQASSRRPRCSRRGGLGMTRGPKL